MTATAVPHADREGDTVTYHHAPECEAHRINYDEAEPAAFVMQTIGNGFHYLCADCRILFCDETKPLGTGVGQRIVVNARSKVQPPPPEPVSTETPPPAKKAAAKKAPAKSPATPNLSVVPDKPAAKKGPAKKAADLEEARAKERARAEDRARARATEAAAKKRAAEDKAKALAERQADDAAKYEAAKQRAEARGQGHLAEPSLQQEVERTIMVGHIGPTKQADADKEDAK